MDPLPPEVCLKMKLISPTYIHFYLVYANGYLLRKILQGVLKSFFREAMGKRPCSTKGYSLKHPSAVTGSSARKRQLRKRKFCVSLDLVAMSELPEAEMTG